MNKNKLIKQQLKGGLIVSCQALENEPLFSEEGGIMSLMALAAKKAKAVGIRANGIRDIIEIKETVNLPVIGIIKKQYEGYAQHITVTEKEIKELMAIGVEIIAFDCTNRKRPEGYTIEEYMNYIRKKYPDQLFMADVSSYEEGVLAAKCGIDFIGTTLSGYTEYTTPLDGPDFELVKRLNHTVDVPIIAEGRIHYPHQAKQMIQLGAYSVVVGGAITRPQEITKRFVDEISK